MAVTPIKARYRYCQHLLFLYEVAAEKTAPAHNVVSRSHRTGRTTSASSRRSPNVADDSLSAPFDVYGACRAILNSSHRRYSTTSSARSDGKDC